jgi:hydroxyethylthiazole kinase
LNASFDARLCRQLLKAIADKAPLVHHITNWVTISDCAQITRSTGALPVMAHMREDAVEMVGFASALVLNIGTLTESVLSSMVAAGKTANDQQIPVVLDMVGCGATGVRTRAVERLLDSVGFAILKGNAGEVAVASGSQAVVKGVESGSVSGDIPLMAGQLAQSTGAVVVVTGQTDIVTDDHRLHLCRAGHALMGQVVGTGCMATSVLGAFAAVSHDAFQAAVSAMNFYGTAGQHAAKRANAPVAYKAALMDTVYRMARAQMDFGSTDEGVPEP